MKSFCILNTTTLWFLQSFATLLLNDEFKHIFLSAEDFIMPQLLMRFGYLGEFGRTNPDLSSQTGLSIPEFLYGFIQPKNSCHPCRRSTVYGVEWFLGMHLKP